MYATDTVVFTGLLIETHEGIAFSLGYWIEYSVV